MRGSHDRQVEWQRMERKIGEAVAVNSERRDNHLFHQDFLLGRCSAQQQDAFSRMLNFHVCEDAVDDSAMDEDGFNR